MVIERTFFMIKPDAVSRGLEKDIFSRVEAIGLKVISQSTTHMSPAEAAELYLPHFGKSFYDGLVKYITSSAVICSVVEGENAVLAVRELMGATDPLKADPGTIRGDFKKEPIINEFGIISNLVHGSDSLENAKREIGIFFKDNQ